MGAYRTWVIFNSGLIGFVVLCLFCSSVKVDIIESFGTIMETVTSKDVRELKALVL